MTVFCDRCGLPCRSGAGLAAHLRSCSSPGLSDLAAAEEYCLPHHLFTKHADIPATRAGSSFTGKQRRWTSEDVGNLLRREGWDPATYRILVRRWRREPEPIEEAEREELKRKLHRLLETLTFREREIMKLRYGVGDGLVYTLDECARIFDISRERARQIEAKAMRKLRKSEEARQIEAYVDGFDAAGKAE